MDISGGKLTDLQLVIRVQAGDYKAFGFLVDKYQNKLHKMIMSVVGNPLAAESLVQDAFMNAYQDISSCTADDTFHTWLCNIALMTAANYQSGLASAAQVSSAAHWEGIQESGIFTGSRLAEYSKTESSMKLITQKINDVFSSLSHDMQSAMSFREVDGLSYQQISEMMGCTIETTKSRIFEARKIISENLKPMLYLHNPPLLADH